MISMRNFYLIAGVVMLIVLGANIWNLAISYSYWTLPAIIAFVFGSIIFNLLFVILFFGLWKVTPKQIVNNSELDDIIKQYSRVSEK